MIYVVDSHVLVWFLEGGNKLSPRVRAILRDQANRLLLPTIALAEIKYLISRGRVSLDYARVVRAVSNSQRFVVYPLEAEVVARMAPGLEMHDAIICATAVIYSELTGEDVVVLTKDESMQKANIVNTLW